MDQKTTAEHPADMFSPFLSQYEALYAMIDTESNPDHISALMQAINEGFRAKLDACSS